MLNHIAVILRGHIRTWHLISEYTLSQYDRLAKNVDYYFVTWHQPNTGVSDIYKSFENRNLVLFHMAPIVSDYYNSHCGAAWLPYNILPYKRRREKVVTYDAVIDSRPDITFKLKSNKTIYKPDDNSLYTRALELHFNYERQKLDIAVQDWFFIMSSRVYDIMSQRFIMHDKAGTQISYRIFAEQEGINVCTMDYLNTMIARPCIGGMKLSVETFNSVKLESDKWGQLSREDRLAYANKYHVRVSDYETKCLHAAI